MPLLWCKATLCVWARKRGALRVRPANSAGVFAEAVEAKGLPVAGSLLDALHLQGVHAAAWIAMRAVRGGFVYCGGRLTGAGASCQQPGLAGVRLWLRWRHRLLSGGVFVWFEGRLTGICLTSCHSLLLDAEVCLSRLMSPHLHCCSSGTVLGAFHEPAPLRTLVSNRATGLLS